MPQRQSSAGASWPVSQLARTAAVGQGSPRMLPTRPSGATTHSRKPSTGSGVGMLVGERVSLPLGRLLRHRLLDGQDLGPLVLARDADLLGLADGLHWLSISAPTSNVTATSVATATARYSGQCSR